MWTLDNSGLFSLPLNPYDLFKTKQLPHQSLHRNVITDLMAHREISYEGIQIYMGYFSDLTEHIVQFNILVYVILCSAKIVNFLSAIVGNACTLKLLVEPAWWQVKHMNQCIQQEKSWMWTTVNQWYNYCSTWRQGLSWDHSISNELRALSCAVLLFYQCDQGTKKVVKVMPALSPWKSGLTHSVSKKNVTSVVTKQATLRHLLLVPTINSGRKLCQVL